MENYFDRFDGESGGTPLPKENASAENFFDQFDEPTLKPAQEDRGWINNGIRGAGKFIDDMGAGIVDLAGAAAANTPSGIIGAPAYASGQLKQLTAEEQKKVGESYHKTAEDIRNLDTGFMPNLNTLDEAQKDWKQGNRMAAMGRGARAIGEAAIQSAPAIVGTLVAPQAAIPVLGLGTTGDMSNNRAKNKGLDRPTSTEVGEVAPYAAAITALDSVLPLFLRRFDKGITEKAASDITKSAKLFMAKKVAKGAAAGAAEESLTEGTQQLLQYVGEKYGTDAKMSLEDAWHQTWQAAVLGGGVGGPLGGAHHFIEGHSQVNNVNTNSNQTIDEAQTNQSLIDDLPQPPVAPAQPVPINSDETLAANAQQATGAFGGIADYANQQAENQRQAAASERTAYLDEDTSLASAATQYGEQQGFIKKNLLQETPDDVQHSLEQFTSVDDEINQLLNDISQHHQSSLDKIEKINASHQEHASKIFDDLIAANSAKKIPEKPSAVDKREASLKTVTANLDAGIDRARNAQMPDNLRDVRLLRDRYRNHLATVAHSIDEHGDALKNNDSLLDLAAKNGGLNTEAWAKEGVDPADATKNKAFSKNGKLTPDDLAELAHQQGYLGFANAHGTPDANAAQNAIRDEMTGSKKYYSIHDEKNLRAAQLAPAFIKELKGFGSPEAIKTAITKSLQGKRLGTNQVHIVQEILDRTNAHTRDDAAIKTKWEARAKSMLANKGNRHIEEWRNRADHQTEITTHEAALTEIMTEAMQQYGLDPDNVKTAYEKYSKKYPQMNQLTAAMMSWVSAHKTDTSEHLNDGRETELPRGSSSERRTPEKQSGFSPEHPSAEAIATPASAESATPIERGSDSAGRDAGLRQPINSSPIAKDSPASKSKKPIANEEKKLSKTSPEKSPSDVEKAMRYGANNTLVSSERAALLREKLKAKLNQLNSGIDPETLAIGTELAVYHIEAGTRSFVDFAKAIADDLETTLEKIKPYLRSWYNGARDMMEDSGLNIEGMSSPDDVRQALKTLSDTQKKETIKKPARLADYLLSRLDQIDNNRALKEAVRSYSDLQHVNDVTPEMMKVGQEHLEMALVMNARKIVEASKDNKETFDKLLSSYEKQPLLNIRSSTSIENQAYSTPAPLAFLAGKLAGITADITVYEPTAGNGMLLMGATPKHVFANELDNHRAAQLKHLGFNTTEKDAAEYLPNVKVDSAIMNPPFGSLEKFGKPNTLQYDGYNVKKIDHLITMKALESIKDDGRASIIIAANKEAGEVGSGAERVFMNWLYSHYNVVDHFEVDGDLYRRQGAAWPVRVITVNGRVESKAFAPKSGSIPRFDSWNDIYEHTQHLLDSERFRVERHRENVSESAREADNYGGSTQPHGVKAVEAHESSGGGTRGIGTRSPRNGPELSESHDGHRGSSVNRGNTRARGHDHQHDHQRSSQSDTGEKQSDQRGLNRVGGGANLSSGDGGGNNHRKPVLGGGASEFQAEYKAASHGFNESVLTPKNMAEATQSALSHIQEEVGNIDDYVANKLEYPSVAAMQKGLMALQVDTVAAAIYNIEKRGKGIIIADQTGVGKGRQAAALIRYAMLTGKTPVFVTVKPNLYSDMYGDLLDIGTPNSHPFITNADVGVEHNGETLFVGKGDAHKARLQSIVDHGELPVGKNMLFTSYDQLKGDANNLRREAIQSIKNPLFILDEAHNAAGEMYVEKKVNGKKTKVTTTAGFVYEMLKDNPVVYLSATYAKRPDNMPIYYRTDLLDAVDTPQELIDAVNAGGVPLQQVVASMLASNGQLFRRERSFAGIKMNFVKDTSHVEEQERISDEVNRGLRAVVEASNAFADWYEQNKQHIEPPGGAVKLAGNKADSMAGSVNPFTSVVHNYIRQLLLGIKAKKASSMAIDLYKNGKKPVIALENTMGSFLTEYVEKHRLKIGDPLHFNYNDILKVALERTRRVSFKDDKGNSLPLPIDTHQLDPLTRSLFDNAEETINGIDLSELPASPIDFMLNEMRQAGMQVSEITGRGYFVDYSGKIPVLGIRSSNEKNARRKTVDSFNNGETDALILNSAGSTGLSIHASERFRDQSPRHMIVAQPMQDVNTLMQMLGRINRTGQVELPEFSFLSLDLPAEIRPTATTKAKMAKLNANTSANDKSDTSFEAPDFMNKYGDQVVNEFLQDNPEIERAAGIYASPESAAPDNLALRFTGRLALLDAKVQRQVMSEILDSYHQKIEYLNKTGQNDLVAQELPLDAYIQDSKIIHEGKDPDSIFAGHTTLHQVNVKYLGKPPTADDVAHAIDDALNGESPEQAMRKIIKDKDSDESYERELGHRVSDAVKNHELKKAELAAYESAPAAQEKDEKKVVKLQNSVTSADARLQTAKEALTSYHAQRDNMRDTLSRVLKIGDRIRVDVGDENINAVVVNVKDTHKSGTGNPWVPSKIRITLMVNSGARQISVNYKQLMGKGGLFIESLNGSGKDGLSDIFNHKVHANRREIRYIATGNLIAGAAKLEGGKIASFTDSTGKLHQGILMPRKFGKKGEFEQGNSVSSVVVRDPSVLAKYLGLGGQFSEVGASSPDKAIKVSAGRDGGLTISVPTANKNKTAFSVKLDNVLRKIVGDFYGASQSQTAKIPAGKEREALSRLMELTPLSIPAKMRDALVAVGGDEAPEAVHSFDGKNSQVGPPPKGYMVDQRSDEVSPANSEKGADHAKIKESMAKDPAAKDPIETWDSFDTRDNSPIYLAKSLVTLDQTDFSQLSSIAKSHGGYWSRHAKGFLFKKADDRVAFVADSREKMKDAFSDNIKYSLDADSKKPMSLARSQAVIDELKAHWKGRADIRLVESLEDLPKDVRTRLSADGKTLRDVQGIFHPSTGIIYLNANKITSEEQARELVFHEAYTHLGLSTLFGKNVTAIMGRLYLAMGGQKGIHEFAAAHGIDLSRYENLYPHSSADYRNAVIAEELLAHLAQHPRPKVIQLAKEFVGAIRAWLRTQGFTELAHVSDSDIQYLLKQSRETITKGKRGDTRGLMYTLNKTNEHPLEATHETQQYKLNNGTKETRFGGFSVSGLKEKDFVFGISLDGLLRVWQDKMRPLLRTQEAIKGDGGTITEAQDAYLREEAFHGKTENDLRNMKERFLEPMAEKMAKYGIEREDLDMYLWAKHAQERNEQIAKINPEMQDGGSGMTTAQANEVLQKAKAEGKAQHLEELASTVYSLLEEKRKIARYLAGGEVVDSWNNAYQYYVPLKGRAVDDSGPDYPRVGKGFDVRGKESLRALGRRTKPESPTLHAIKDTTEAIIKYRKNEVGNALLSLVEANPNPEYWEIHDASNPEFERKLLRRNGKETVGSARVTTRDDYFITKRDGKEYWIRIEDPLLMRAMKNMGPEKMNWAVTQLAKASRFLSAMCTKYNPEFVVTNFARDIQTAIINLQAEIDLHDGKAAGKKITAAIIKGVPSAMRAVYTSLNAKTLSGDGAVWQKAFDDFRHDGANTGWYQLKDIDQQAKELESLINAQKRDTKGFALRAMQGIGKFIENTNATVENAIRLSVYKSAVDAGITRKQAASLAKNLTVNFNRKGEIGASMNALYMFFNASVQGTASLARALGTLKVDVHGKRKLNMAQKAAVGIMLASYGLAALNRSLAGDDDDDKNWWDKVPDYEKERNIIIMKSVLGGEENGSYWKIPLPYGYNVFNAAATIAEAAVSGKMGLGKASGGILNAMLDAFSPIGIAKSNTTAGEIVRTAAPTVLKPLADLTTNENFFGNRIYRENTDFDTPKPASHLSLRSTNELWKWAAEFMNDATGGSSYRSGSIDISPDKMGYIFNYFMGSAGKFYSDVLRAGIKTTKGLDVEAKEIPFVRKFTGDVSRFSSQTDFYDRRDKINQVVEEFKSLRGGDEKEQYKEQHGDLLHMAFRAKATAKRLSDIRKRKSKIVESHQLSESEKDEKINELDLKTKTALDAFNKVYDERVKD